MQKLLTASILALAATTAQADPAVMFGINYNFGGGGPGRGELLPDDEPRRARRRRWAHVRERCGDGELGCDQQRAPGQHRFCGYGEVGLGAGRSFAHLALFSAFVM